MRTEKQTVTDLLSFTIRGVKATDKKKWHVSDREKTNLGMEIGAF
jgi:hypothetical protein